MESLSYDPNKKSYNTVAADILAIVSIGLSAVSCLQGSERSHASSKLLMGL